MLRIRRWRATYPGRRPPEMFPRPCRHTARPPVDHPTQRSRCRARTRHRSPPRTSGRGVRYCRPAAGHRPAGRRSRAPAVALDHRGQPAGAHRRAGAVHRRGVSREVRDRARDGTDRAAARGRRAAGHRAAGDRLAAARAAARVRDHAAGRGHRHPVPDGVRGVRRSISCCRQPPRSRMLALLSAATGVLVGAPGRDGARGAGRARRIRRTGADVERRRQPRAAVLVLRGAERGPLRDRVVPAVARAEPGRLRRARSSSRPRGASRATRRIGSRRPSRSSCCLRVLRRHRRRVRAASLAQPCAIPSTARSSSARRSSLPRCRRRSCSASSSAWRSAPSRCRRCTSALRALLHRRGSCAAAAAGRVVHRARPRVRDARRFRLHSTRGGPRRVGARRRGARVDGTAPRAAVDARRGRAAAGRCGGRFRACTSTSRSASSRRHAATGFPFLNSTFVGAALIALAGGFSAWRYSVERRTPGRARRSSRRCCSRWALLWWLGAGVHDIERFFRAERACRGGRGVARVDRGAAARRGARPALDDAPRPTLAYLPALAGDRAGAGRAAPRRRQPPANGRERVVVARRAVRGPARAARAGARAPRHRRLARSAACTRCCCGSSCSSRPRKPAGRSAA